MGGHRLEKNVGRFSRVEVKLPCVLSGWGRLRISGLVSLQLGKVWPGAETQSPLMSGCGGSGSPGRSVDRVRRGWTQGPGESRKCEEEEEVGGRGAGRW